MCPIIDMAASLGVPCRHLTLFGDDKAKVSLAALDSGRPRGKLVLVSAITPTDADVGNTTISIGLAQGLSRIGKKTNRFPTIRRSSGARRTSGSRCAA